MATATSKLDSSDFKQFIQENQEHLTKLRDAGIQLKSSFNPKQDNVNGIVSYIARFQKERNGLNVWRDQIKKIDAIGFKEVKEKGDNVDAEFETCLKDIVQPLFETALTDQFEKANSCFKLVLEKLKTFRVRRSEENYDPVHEHFEAFKHSVTTVTNLSEFSKRCSLCLNKDQSQSIQKIETQFKYLEKQVDVYCLSLPINLAYQFQFLLLKGLPDNQVEWQATTSSFDHQIQQLSHDVRESLDHKFYELSPPPKGGKDWGKLHRWDDLGRFQNALLQTIRQLKEKEVRETLNSKVINDSFYQALHAVAFGPDKQDAVTWAKREFPYLTDLIPAALEKMKKD